MKLMIVQMIRLSTKDSDEWNDPLSNEYDDKIDNQETLRRRSHDGGTKSKSKTVEVRKTVWNEKYYCKSNELMNEWLIKCKRKKVRKINN